MQQNRRHAARSQSDKLCKVYVPGAPVIICTIADRSEEGAKLIFSSKVPTDERLLMAIVAKGDLWSGSVRWREGNSLGVQFERGLADLLD